MHLSSINETSFSPLLIASVCCTKQSPTIYSRIVDGLLLGIGHSFCLLLEKGLLDHDFTKIFLATLEVEDDAPQSSFDKAVEALRADETLEGCPFPPKE